MEIKRKIFLGLVSVRDFRQFSINFKKGAGKYSSCQFYNKLLICILFKTIINKLFSF
jgi:hypothetical protein